MEHPQEVSDNPDGATEEFVKSRGLRFPKDRSILTRRLIRDLSNNMYEFKEADALRWSMQKDDIVMELGGGIGFMSSLAARRCPEGRVHTFEANPALIPYIHRVHAANNFTNIEVNHALLGPSKGKSPFYIRKNILSSSIDPPDEDSDVKKAEVEVRNATEESRRIKPTVFLCDIEGAEAHVVPLLDLSTVRLAIIELHPQWIGSEGVRAVFEAFMKHGLVYFPRRSKAKVVCFRRNW
ncbi:MAG: FkbM family methyltransferase [Paracoccaceae bacterium]